MRYKARFVTQDSAQKLGINYNETYASVINAITL
jgi:hypothetical protein